MALLDGETWQRRIFLGAWEEGGGGVAEVREPATGALLGHLGLAAPEDLERAGDGARAAQREWAEAPFTVREAVLRRAGELWEENAPELESWLQRETGSVPGKAGFETHVAARECYAAAALPGHPRGQLLPSEEPRLSLVERVPVGVVGVIAPFNAPLILAIRSVAPALALGNAVLLKPDPRTGVSGGVALARVFEEAGLPPGLLQVLPGGAEVGRALVEAPAVRVVSFTGSTAAGRAVAGLAARHLKRVHLELGGNSALVVLADADLEPAVRAGAWGSFFHQGQICMAAGRHLVEASIYPRYVEALAERAEAATVGDPFRESVALGPLIDAVQRDKVHRLVTASVSAGARLEAGGEFRDLFYRPTVLSGAGPGIPAYDEEVFGPVAPVVPFESLEEAAALAAASDYGLSLGIITHDLWRGLELARRIPTGIVHINDQTINDEAVAPFGGVQDSGTGARFGGAEANLAAFTDSRWITARGRVPDFPI